MMIWKEFKFDSAHYLPNVPEGHKCKRMHGHTFTVRVEVFGIEGDESGWVMDFADINAAVEPIIKMLDHALLNDFAGLENPTSENIAKFFWVRLKPSLPLICAVEVQETRNTGARITG